MMYEFRSKLCQTNEQNEKMYNVSVCINMQRIDELACNDWKLKRLRMF